MQEFYTNVSMDYSGNILYRGYNDGKRVQGKIPYSPTLFVESKEPDSKWVQLYGVPLAPKKFETVRLAKEYCKMYGDMVELYGYQPNRFEYQFIAQNFPDELAVAIGDVRVTSIDIETEIGDSGFPNPYEAEEPISLITLHDFNTGKLKTFGYTPSTTENFTLCQDESDMLRQFIQHVVVSDPDILVGWHIKGFDIPFLINRCNRVLGEAFTKKLSPFGKIDCSEENIKGKEVQVFTIVGRTILDLLDLYQKFTFVKRETYKLDHIAEVELKKNKLENPFSTFKEFYTGVCEVETEPPKDAHPLTHKAFLRTSLKRSEGCSEEWHRLDKEIKQESWDLFVKYNQIDAILVSELEEKLGLISLVLSISYLAKINYTDVFSPVKTWEMFILGYLMNVENKFCSIKRQNNSSDGFIGAYVHDPKPGFYDWVVSGDFSSLYPNIIKMLNISPETLIGVNDQIEESSFLNGDIEFSNEDYAVAASGAMFTKDDIGILPKLVNTVLDGRKIAKNKMIALKKEKELILAELDRRGIAH